MKAHDYSPNESEEILNAVYAFLRWDHSTLSFIKNIEEMQYNFIEHAMEDKEESDGELVLTVSPTELGRTVFSNRILRDFLYKLEEAVHVYYTPRQIKDFTDKSAAQ